MRAGMTEESRAAVFANLSFAGWGIITLKHYRRACSTVTVKEYCIYSEYLVRRGTLVPTGIYILGSFILDNRIPLGWRALLVQREPERLKHRALLPHWRLGSMAVSRSLVTFDIINY